MNRNRMLRWVCLGLIVGAAGCALKARSQKVSASAVKSYPVIVSLVGRNDVITITTGPGSRAPLYSAKTKTGVVLVSNSTLDELRERHPQVYRQVHPGIAVQADGGEAIVGGYAGIGTE